MIKFEVTTNDQTGLNTAADRLRQGISDGLKEQAPAMIQTIQSRTAQGDAYQGGRFPAYSPAYAKIKAAKTGSSLPNLRLTGGMLGSLKHKLQRTPGLTTLKIMVTGAFNQRKAFWNQGGNSRIPARRFMGFKHQEFQLMVRAIFSKIRF